MCHFLPVHHLEWHFWPGRRSEYNIKISIQWFFFPFLLSSCCSVDLYVVNAFSGYYNYFLFYFSGYYNFFFFSFFWKFFTPALASGFSLESELKQVSSNLLDSCQYSGRSQKCSSLDCLHSSSFFQVLQSLYQSFVGCTEHASYNRYHYHSDVL